MDLVTLLQWSWINVKSKNVSHIWPPWDHSTVPKIEEMNKSNEPSLSNSHFAFLPYELKLDFKGRITKKGLEIVSEAKNTQNDSCFPPVFPF